MSRYGPHREADLPTVEVLTGGAKKGRPIQREQRPMPPELVKQRRDLNTHAHEENHMSTEHNCHPVIRCCGWPPFDRGLDEEVAERSDR